MHFWKRGNYNFNYYLVTIKKISSFFQGQEEEKIKRFRILTSRAESAQVFLLADDGSLA